MCQHDVLQEDSALGLASRPIFAQPGLVSRRETWRPYVPHFSCATHRTVMGEDRRLRYTDAPVFPWHGMAWTPVGDLGLHGESSALVSPFHSELL
jgi:hypothetical protein